MNEFEFLLKVVPWLVPAFTGFVGVLTGAWLTGRRERAQRQHLFLADQLKYFYSPLLGIRNQIRLRSEIREEISLVADAEWREMCEDAQLRGVDAQMELSERRSEEFMKIINYDNELLRTELIPAYKQMLSILRDQMWLAEPETRALFSKLVRFVDIWDRWIANSLPREVLMRLHHQEADLQPLYSHLQEKHDQLRAQLAKGNFEITSRSSRLRIRAKS